MKAQSSKYRLFLKHWDPRWMPPRHRGDIVFVDDSQKLASLEAMADEFAAWGPTFAPNTVAFQIGYRSDRVWWRTLESPIVEMGEAICSRVTQPCGIVWVDFTLRELMPPGALSPHPGDRRRPDPAGPP